MFSKLTQFISLIGNDKLLHFTVCLLLTLILYAIGSALGLGVIAIAPAFVITMGAGIGKEIYDSKHGGQFDHYDIVSDFVGCFIAVVISALLLI